MIIIKTDDYAIDLYDSVRDDGVKLELIMSTAHHKLLQLGRVVMNRRGYNGLDDNLKGGFTNILELPFNYNHIIGDEVLSSCIDAFTHIEKSGDLSITITLMIRCKDGKYKQETITTIHHGVLSEEFINRNLAIHLLTSDENFTK